MDHLKLTVDKLSVDTITDLVTDDSCGAVSLFIGTTRDNFEGKKVLRLEYEAYEPMAIKAMKAICEEVRDKWPVVHSIAMYHRLGNVPSREASVVIAISSPHRRESLEAVSHCIERLKASVPIWKKEIYETDAPKWKENAECETTQQPTTEVHIDKNLVQINVSSEELQKRIQNFIEKKREQVNLNNIHDFIPDKGENETEDAETCARVRTQFVRRSDSKGHLKEKKRELVNLNSIHDFIPNKGENETEDAETCARVRTQFVRRSDSKRHLKVHKVDNEWGPQTVQSFPSTNQAEHTGLPSSIAERVLNIETFLNIGPVPRDIYKRLKDMEDKIAYLQSVSPEYAMFWKSNREDIKEEKTIDYTFSADDISRKIEQLEKMNM